MEDFGQDDEVVFGIDDEVVDGGNAATDFLGQFNRRAMQGLDFMNAPRRAVGNVINDLRGAPRAETATEIATSMGAASAEEPDSIAGMMGKGGADALMALAPVMGALNQMKAIGGVTGSIADDLLAQLSTKTGLTMEALAGMMSGGAQEAAKEAGAPEWGQDIAGLVAPLSIPAMGAMGRKVVSGADWVTDRLPVANYVKRVGKEAIRGIAPQSEAGAREQARSRLQELAGGRERADELGQMVDPSDEFGRTGAEMTGDPNLLGLQEAARRENPVLRESMNTRNEATRETITDAVRALGGDVTNARAFFRRRVTQFGRAMDERIKDALSAGDEVIQGVRPGRSDEEMSEVVVEKLKGELASARAEERALWAEVPQDTMVPTGDMKAIAKQIQDETSIFQTEDVPAAASILNSNQVGDEIAASEVHGLYSKMKQIARNARAGENQNANLARLADKLADAADKALESIPGQAAAEARAFTRTLHEKFHTGATGKLLARTAQTVERVPPEAALERTVGRGGAQGGVDARNIAKAAPDAAQEVRGYVTNQFVDKAINASGDFTPAAARLWMRNNQSLLRDNPDLAAELDTALRSREAVQAFAVRSEARAKVAMDGTITRFNSGQPEKAVTAIIGADNPVKAAITVANAARKDPTGQALAGVKGAFTDFLTKDIDKMPALFADAKISSAMRRIFDDGELQRLKRISDAMRAIDAPRQEVGEVIHAETTKVIDFVVRYYAAKTASNLHSGGGAGVDLQVAQMASSNARRWLEGVTNNRARQILMDAVEDPALMRALLTDAPNGNLSPKARAKLAPYLTGGIAAEN